MSASPNASPTDDRRWPWAIAIGLAIVIAVNVAFAWVAIRNPDPLVRSYQTEAR